MGGVSYEVACNLSILHAVFLHTLNLAIPKPFDCLSAVTCFLRVKSSLHDMVEFQPMSECRFDSDKHIEAVGTDQKSASEYAESTR